MIISESAPVVAAPTPKPVAARVDMESLYDAMIKSNDDLASYEAAERLVVTSSKQNINFVEQKDETVVDNSAVESSPAVESVPAVENVPAVQSTPVESVHKKTKKHKKKKSKKVLKKPVVNV